MLRDVSKKCHDVCNVLSNGQLKKQTLLICMHMLTKQIGQIMNNYIWAEGLQVSIVLFFPLFLWL